MARRRLPWALRRALRLAALPVCALATAAACQNSGSQCNAPSSGSFTLKLAYAQSVPIDLVCDGSAPAADGGATCASVTHPLDGTSAQVVTSGGHATVTLAGASWTCNAIGPQSGPAGTPDGGTSPGTSCDLLVTCGSASFGDAGASSQVEIELLPPSTTSDVLVLVHETGGACCTDQYTGTWTSG